MKISVGVVILLALIILASVVLGFYFKDEIESGVKEGYVYAQERTDKECVEE